MKKPLLSCLSSPLLLLCLMGFTGSARWPLIPLRAPAPETFETGTEPDYLTGTVAFTTGS